MSGDVVQEHVRAVAESAEYLLTPQAKRNLERMACDPDNRQRFVEILATLRAWQPLIGRTQRSLGKAIPVLDAALRRTAGKVRA